MVYPPCPSLGGERKNGPGPNDTYQIVCMGMWGHELPHYNGTHEWGHPSDTGHMLMEVFDPAACCIVEDCRNEPKPQVCPYDGKRHHHGSIHVECYKGTKLKFRSGYWMWICDEDYKECEDELEARTGKRRTAHR